MCGAVEYTYRFFLITNTFARGTVPLSLMFDLKV